MDANSTQLEILLMTGSRLTERLSAIEQLEEACWNGLLFDLLPEVAGDQEGTKKLFIWRIRQMTSFLELDLGEGPAAAAEATFTLDPLRFIEAFNGN